jgi:hypothetical protein
MKCSAPVLLACTAALLLVSSGCNYVKPMMYVDLENQSGHPMENLELKYPNGSFGLPELRDQQTHQHMVPIGAPCKFSISFEDQAGKAYTGDFDFGAKCPAEVAFAVGAGMSVSQRVVRP